jgi:hypothetical protein
MCRFRLGRRAGIGLADAARHPIRAHRAFANSLVPPCSHDVRGKGRDLQTACCSAVAAMFPLILETGWKYFVLANSTLGRHTRHTVSGQAEKTGLARSTKGWRDCDPAYRVFYINCKASKVLSPFSCLATTYQPRYFLSGPVSPMCSFNLCPIDRSGGFRLYSARGGGTLEVQQYEGSPPKCVSQPVCRIHLPLSALRFTVHDALHELTLGKYGFSTSPSFCLIATEDFLATHSKSFSASLCDFLIFRYGPQITLDSDGRPPTC